ncbi:MAG: DnaA/Hda family protein [Candidatus Omnitrophota bacterium]|jgi:hypothetical protein
MQVSDTLPIVYPQEIKGLINSGMMIPLRIESKEAGQCENCGGLGYLFVFEKGKDSKPLRYPPGIKSKWIPLGNMNADDKLSGWYVGETKQVDCPVCAKGQMKSWLEKNCGLFGSDLNVSLADFSITGMASAKKQAHDEVAKILSMNQLATGFITFYGSFGCGKSHLLKSIVNGLRGIGLRTFYSTMADLLTDIRTRFGEPNGSREVATILEFYRSIKVLCIDEFDRVNMTGWAMETIFTLVDDRSTHKDEVLTVMASNKEPKNLPSEFGYLTSRINGGVIVSVPPPDMRPALKDDWTDK